VIWHGEDCILNQHIFRCDLDFSRITREWAKFALNARLNRLIDLAHGGVGLKHVTKGVVERLEVPLPPIAEQRRIAAILDQAESLRAKRRRALDRLDEFLQSLFFDLFGDPVANAKGWKRVRVAEVVTGIDSGWSPTCLDRPVRGEEWGVLKLGAVTWCEYAPDQNKALPQNLEPDPKLEVRSGDLLFTRKNTYDLVGACAIVRQTPPRLMLPDLVFRLRLRPDAGIDPDYLHRLLINPRKRREIQKLAGGSAGSMPNISKGRLLGAAIEVPPPPLQRAFAAQVAAVERLKASHRASLAKLDALFASLQHRAFRGEL
jgi:type I restriction enzyme S subunit